MAIPLPGYLKKYIENNVNDDYNLSLKYYKWANFYNNDFTDTDSKTKENFIEDIAKNSKNKVVEYKKAFLIRQKLLENIGLKIDNLKTASRVVFGIGYQCATEIGFMFDWTSGFPIIPGSSLKGAALRTAKYAKSGDVQIKNDKGEIIKIDEVIEEIFGSPEKGSGRIIFLPAYPVITGDKPFLELDVMTPHYQEYYTDKEGKTPPADWFSPKPHKFLTVPEGIDYCFRLADRKNLSCQDSELLQKTKAILTYTLKEFGVGAKTGVFYGYFNER